jgi:hypothetical protein
LEDQTKQIEALNKFYDDNPSEGLEATLLFCEAGVRRILKTVYPMLLTGLLLVIAGTLLTITEYNTDTEAFLSYNMTNSSDPQ